tara:strand:- start:250 stop:534 length:285 start_codon:yes stop_codon:yes gene_type:complete
LINVKLEFPQKEIPANKAREPETRHLPGLYLTKDAGGISEPSGWGTNFFKHSQVEVIHGDVSFEVNVPSSSEFTPRMAGEDNWEIVVGMTISIR